MTWSHSTVFLRNAATCRGPEQDRCLAVGTTGMRARRRSHSLKTKRFVEKKTRSNLKFRGFGPGGGWGGGTAGQGRLLCTGPKS